MTDDLRDRLQRAERSAHALVLAEGSAWLPRTAFERRFPDDGTGGPRVRIVSDILPRGSDCLCHWSMTVMDATQRPLFRLSDVGPRRGLTAPLEYSSDNGEPGLGPQSRYPVRPVAACFHTANYSGFEDNDE